MIGRLRAADHAILTLNLLLLLAIGLIPFATALFDTYLKQGHGDSLAAAVYGGAFLLMAITFATLNWHILFRKTHLLAPELSEQRRRRILTRSVIGVIPYVIATARAAVSPYVTLAITTGPAIYYAFPIASGLDAGG
jgi:uncharacterized membrane protein